MSEHGETADIVTDAVQTPQGKEVPDTNDRPNTSRWSNRGQGAGIGWFIGGACLATAVTLSVTVPQSTVTGDFKVTTAYGAIKKNYPQARDITFEESQDGVSLMRFRLPNGAQCIAPVDLTYVGETYPVGSDLELVSRNPIAICTAPIAHR
jgi:hypothetical protein